MDSLKEAAPATKAQEPSDQELAVFVHNLLEQMVIHEIIIVLSITFPYITYSISFLISSFHFK